MMLSYFSVLLQHRSLSRVCTGSLPQSTPLYFILHALQVSEEVVAECYHITNPLSFFVVSGSTETWMNVIPFVIIHKYSCMTIQHSATKEESKYRLYLLMDRLSLCTPINSLLCWTSMRVGLCTCTHVSVWLDLVLSYQSRGNRLLLQGVRMTPWLLLLSTW